MAFSHEVRHTGNSMSDQFTALAKILADSQTCHRRQQNRRRGREAVEAKAGQEEVVEPRSSAEQEKEIAEALTEARNAYRQEFTVSTGTSSRSRSLGGPVIGFDWTPAYFGRAGDDHSVPARVAELIPWARFVVLIRDPTDKAMLSWLLSTRRVRGAIQVDV